MTRPPPIAEDSPFYSADSPRMVQILKKHFGSWDVPLTGVEIGVHRGLLSSRLLRKFPKMTLFMVDIWAPMDQPNRFMDWAIRDTEFAKDRRVILRVESANAVSGFWAGQLDWLFIDADHRYPAVSEDMRIWWDKVRSGGLFAGHDYVHHFPGVIQAVDEFVAQHGVKLNVQGWCWWIVKP